MNKRLRTIFLNVLCLPTAPFPEDAVAGFIRNFARRRGIPKTADRYGNVVLRYTKGEKAESVALTARVMRPLPNPGSAFGYRGLTPVAVP